MTSYRKPRQAVHVVALAATMSVSMITYSAAYDTVPKQQSPLFVKAAGTSGATKSQENNATVFIQSMGDQVIKYISSSNADTTTRKEQLRGILLQNFDMNTISRFTLGVHWKSLNAEQQKEYQSLLENMIVSIYADKFSSYHGEKFEVTGSSLTTDGDYSVTSNIVPLNGQKIPVKWRIRDKESTGTFKIVDVAIKDISMIITQRADFASTIQNNGGNAVSILDFLREREKSTQ